MSSDLQQKLEELIASQERICEQLHLVTPWQDWRPNRSEIEWSFRLIGAHLAKIEKESFLYQLNGLLNRRNQSYSHYWNTEDELGRPDLADSIISWKERRRQLVERIKNIGPHHDELSAPHDVVGTITPLRLVELVLNHDHDHERHLTKIIELFHQEE